MTSPRFVTSLKNWRRKNGRQLHCKQTLFTKQTFVNKHYFVNKHS